MRLNFLLLLYLTNKKKVAWQRLRKGNAIVLSHNICLTAVCRAHVFAV